MKNDNFEQSHSAEKSEMGTLWDFQTSIMFQNIKKIEGGIWVFLSWIFFGTMRLFFENFLIVPKGSQSGDP